MSIHVWQQKISVGHNFNGTAPVGSYSDSDGIERRYAAAAAGGLFQFDAIGRIEQIELVLGGQTSWSISKVDSDGIEIVLWSGTTEASFVTVSSDRIMVLHGQSIKVVTVGASTAMTARIAISEGL